MPAESIRLELLDLLCIRRPGTVTLIHAITLYTNKPRGRSDQ
jgi:hypothetical protein